MNHSHVAAEKGLEPRPEARRLDLVDYLLDADVRGVDALLEAGERYGGDAERELRDLEAGQHPAQRPR